MRATVDYLTWNLNIARNVRLLSPLSSTPPRAPAFAVITLPQTLLYWQMRVRNLPLPEIVPRAIPRVPSSPLQTSEVP